MSTHSHIGNPCKICAYPLTGKDAANFLENKEEPGLMAYDRFGGYTRPLRTNVF